MLLFCVHKLCKSDPRSLPLQSGWGGHGSLPFQSTCFSLLSLSAIFSQTFKPRKLRLNFSVHFDFDVKSITAKFYYFSVFKSQIITFLAVFHFKLLDCDKMNVYAIVNEKVVDTGERHKKWTPIQIQIYTCGWCYTWISPLSENKVCFYFLFYITWSGKGQLNFYKNIFSVILTEIGQWLGPIWNFGSVLECWMFTMSQLQFV